MVREIDCNIITDAVRQMCVQAAYDIVPKMEDIFHEAVFAEESELGRCILTQMLLNLEIAKTERRPVCQDTGIAVFFVDIGTDLHITGGSLTDAINEGVRQGYKEGYLRKSMLADPLFDRKNTGDNTPACINYNFVPGDKLHITVLPKGGGSENVGAVIMLKPSDGVEGVKKFVVNTIVAAGGASCPPIIIGVGIGGCMDKAAMLSKKALIRTVGEKNADPRYAALEQAILDEVNASGIGPQGLGGSTTAIACHIEEMPTHMACLPVAVSVLCSAAHRAEITL